MKRVLVTGHRGLLGSACVKVLSKNYEVLTTGEERIDLRNRDEVYWLFNRLSPEFVVHCAAKVGGVKANRDNPVDFIQDNVAINGNIIAACHAFNVKKLVNTGTSCLYPNKAPIPVKEESFMTGPFEPDVEAYAAAKLLAHYTCRAYRSQYGCNFVTASPANLFGPGDNYGPSGHVLPSLIHRAFEAKQNNTKLRVWGDGTAVREFLHSHDAAEALRIVLERWDSPELINIGSGVGTTIRDLSELVARLVGVRGVEYDESQPVGIQEKTFDVSKLKALGWKQKIRLEHGISMAIDEYRATKADGTLRFK